MFVRASCRLCRAATTCDITCAQQLPATSRRVASCTAPDHHQLPPYQCLQAHLLPDPVWLARGQRQRRQQQQLPRRPQGVRQTQQQCCSRGGCGCSWWCRLMWQPETGCAQVGCASGGVGQIHPQQSACCMGWSTLCVAGFTAGLLELPCCHRCCCCVTYLRGAGFDVRLIRTQHQPQPVLPPAPPPAAAPQLAGGSENGASAAAATADAAARPQAAPATPAAGASAGTAAAGGKSSGGAAAGKPGGKAAGGTNGSQQAGKSGHSSSGAAATHTAAPAVPSSGMCLVFLVQHIMLLVMLLSGGGMGLRHCVCDQRHCRLGSMSSHLPHMLRLLLVSLYVCVSICLCMCLCLLSPYQVCQTHPPQHLPPHLWQPSQHGLKCSSSRHWALLEWLQHPC